MGLVDFKVIRSTSTEESEILQHIIDLHVPQGFIDCDPTYGRGNFYKNGIKDPEYRFDIQPQDRSTIPANAENLPLSDDSINCLMFDPPFLSTRGPSLNNHADNINIIPDRFTVYPTEKELHLFYIKALTEFYRILKTKGVLIFKCQDKVSSGSQYFTHCFIHEKAIEIGFYPKDLFILLANNRIISSRHKNQQHARKFHAYFWVFEKHNKNVWKKLRL